MIVIRIQIQITKKKISKAIEKQFAEADVCESSKGWSFQQVDGCG